RLHTLTVTFLPHPPSTTYISTLSLHDALPIWHRVRVGLADRLAVLALLLRARHAALLHPLHRPALRAVDRLLERAQRRAMERMQDRKSTRLNSSHGSISYAVFCLKKKIKDDTI